MKTGKFGITDFGGFFYRLGVNYANYGRIKDNKGKLVGYFVVIADKITDDQKQLIADSWNGDRVEWKTTAPSYAPELKKTTAILYRKGAS